VSTTTILIIVFSIIGFYCLVGLAFFTMCSCCGERNKGVTLTSSAQPAAGYPLVAGSQPYTGGSQPQYTPHYGAQPAQPYGAQSYGSQSNGAQQYGGYPQPNSPGYGGPSAPPPPPAYGQSSPFVSFFDTPFYPPSSLPHTHPLRRTIGGRQCPGSDGCEARPNHFGSQVQWPAGRCTPSFFLPSVLCATQPH
jgi:hypothetical protein